MDSNVSERVTELLQRWNAGDRDCLNALIPLVEQELPLPLNEGPVFSTGKSAALVALDDALDDFARIDPRKARVEELGFFGGLSVDETAEVLKVHPNTVIRDWSLARAWLKRELMRGTSTHAG